MKKQILFTTLLFVLAVSFISAQSKDLILVVDTSASMSGFYGENSRYLTGQFLDENLNLGDTLHLISFSSKPRFEIARRVLDIGDVQTVIGRILLLYPVDPSGDAGAALNYAERYVRGLADGRPKQIFFVSDGEGGDIDGLVSASSSRLSGTGTSLRYLKAPLVTTARRTAASGSAASSGAGGTGSPAAGNTAGTSAAQNAASGDTGTASRGTAVSGGAGPDNAGPGDAGTGPAARAADSSGEASGVDSGNTNSGNANTGDTTTIGGTDSGNGNTGTSDSGAGPGTNTTPKADTTAGNRTAAGAAGDGGSSFISSLPIPLLIILGILILLILAFIIIMMMRNLHSSPNRVMAAASQDDTAARNAELLNSFAKSSKEASLTGAAPRRHYRDDSNQFLTNPPMLNLFVEEQNTAIGRRNVHTLKSGSIYTVGGGSSDFLIFLVPLPARLGELHFDGTNCTFVPLKSQYFPDIGSQRVTECIGKTIRIISDKKYELFFHFERYKDPLIALNQLLHSINVPEK